MIFIWQIRIYDICINCRRCRAPLILCSSIRISDDSLLAASVPCMHDYSIILISFFPKPKVKERKQASSLPSTSKVVVTHKAVSVCLPQPSGGCH